MRAAALVLVAACHAAAPHPQDLATRGAPALKALDAAQLERDTKYLASDELEGRAPGTPGGAKAEQYIADRYRALGLQPAGEHGTYFQTVQLREASLADASFVIHAAGGDVGFEQKRTILLRAYPRAADISLDAPLVFVGYGIARADLGYDDLAGVALHGAIAVIFGGAPRTIRGKPVDPALHAVLADVASRSRALRDHGAAAYLVIFDPVRAEHMPWATFVPRAPTSAMAWLAGGAPASDPVIPSVLIDAGGLDRVAGDGVAHALWSQLDRGEHPAIDLHATGSLHIHSQLHDVTARNVIGMLPGGDLAAEYVVYTAHHDHLGVGEPVRGDSIYNGAIDNAIGVAAMLQIAHGLRALPRPPRRSTLFVAVTGEEKGLLGSEYFATNPTVPAERIVADINIDGGTPDYVVHDVVALGSEHSTLAVAAQAAAHAAGLGLSADPEPEKILFIRSDQFSFVKRGIPALHAEAGYLDASGKTEANRAISNAWMDTHYHLPSDQWEPGYRAENTLPETRFELLVGLAVADADTRPAWNPGDVFAGVGKPAARRDSPQPVSPGVDGSAKPR